MISFNFRPNHNEDVVERVYFIYSFGFLLTRTVAVSLFASEVDSASKEPAKLLCSLPYSIDNVEVGDSLLVSFFNCHLLGGQVFKPGQDGSIITER